MRTFKKFLMAFWGKILSYIIPVHAKRIMFITTLYGYMTGKDEDVAALKKLNDAMTLATTSPTALVLPNRLWRKVWRGNGGDAVNWNDDVLKRRILARCPCWLHYGRDSDLLNDIRQLQQFVSKQA